MIDKPAGETSNATLQRIKRLLGARKAGHTGSLDPLATGVLPLCFGEATKFSQQLLDADKTYLTTARLGIRTTTSDADGEPVAEKPVPAEIDLARVETVLEQFRGAIEQVPSMYSALKYQGRPLYAYAREGRTVPREARPVRIYQLDCVAFEGSELTLRVSCSKGTYIRTLVDDIGEALNTGAHVTMLRRESAGPFGLGDACTPEWLEAREQSAREARLLPVDSLVQTLPSLALSSAQARSILNGQAVTIPDSEDQPEPGDCRLYADGQFIGLGQVTPEGVVTPRRLMSTESQALS